MRVVYDVLFVLFVLLAFEVNTSEHRSLYSGKMSREVSRLLVVWFVGKNHSSLKRGAAELSLPSFTKCCMSRVRTARHLRVYAHLCQL